MPLCCIFFWVNFTCTLQYIMTCQIAAHWSFPPLLPPFGTVQTWQTSFVICQPLIAPLILHPGYITFKILSITVYTPQNITLFSSSMTILLHVSPTYCSRWSAVKSKHKSLTFPSASAPNTYRFISCSSRMALNSLVIWLWTEEGYDNRSAHNDWRT